jgi:hypothetical protein
MTVVARTVCLLCPSGSYVLIYKRQLFSSHECVKSYIAQRLWMRVIIRSDFLLLKYAPVCYYARRAPSRRYHKESPTPLYEFSIGVLIVDANA